MMCLLIYDLKVKPIVTTLIDIFPLVCPTGSFLNAANNGTCEVCPINKYSADINTDSCIDCPFGTNTRQMTGRNSRDACSKYHSVAI